VQVLEEMTRARKSRRIIGEKRHPQRNQGNSRLFVNREGRPAFRLCVHGQAAREAVRGRHNGHGIEESGEAGSVQLVIRCPLSVVRYLFEESKIVP
jgi:hypothetical protein